MNLPYGQEVNIQQRVVCAAVRIKFRNRLSYTNETTYTDEVLLLVLGTGIVSLEKLIAYLILY